jgi:hypothetical protein
MAPTVYLDHATDDFYKGVADLTEVIYDSFHFAKVYEVFGPKWKDYASVVCLFAKHFCDEETVSGVPVTDYVNEKRVRILNQREPAGASVKSVLHLSELMKTSEFQQFNYYND